MNSPFTRIQYLIGSLGINLLQEAHVVVVGLGGVGGMSAEVLVRSGIGKMTIIDFDTVEITNLNRQIITNSNNIGQKKADILKERLLLINPKLQIEAHAAFIDQTNIDQIIPKRVDFVLDAIDKLDAKVDLIKYCLTNKIPFISAMGAGQRFEPLKLKVATINQTHTDPLARALRKKLRDQKVDDNFPVVFSTEQPQPKRFENVGSYMPVTSFSGTLMADYAIKNILSKEVKELVLAGGCFWGVEAYYKQLYGVVKTSVGYTDGDTENPTYEDLKAGRVNHVEACKIWYRPDQISFETLLEHFFRIVDPTALNYQGNDIGIQYRNAIFFQNEEERDIIINVLKEKQKKYQRPIVTIVKEVQPFYDAEDYHQDYLTKNLGGYCHINLNLVKDEERK
ncbi:MAG: peptide-methionine (S)-S-oxide reductase MsrA [Bacilli bacterium]|jgi:peptide-methionine (S)-S-oxide reductase|nr:peptide-methionine (S)-S-oxide reductase MsrA [Acholeplasmataceae bacterium]